MTQENRTSLLPEDAIEGAATPPGRYYVKESGCVDDFDYGGSQSQQTAVRMLLVNEAGAEFENFWTVGDKNRIRPTADGTGLTGAPISKSCNAFHLFDQAVRTAGLPANVLQEKNLLAFKDVWVDFDDFTPPGRTANARGNMPKTLIPIKMYLDGQQPAAPVTTATTVAPPAPPTQAPAAPPQAPAPPPAPAQVPPAAPPVPTAPAPEAVASPVADLYPGMVKVAQALLQNPDVATHTRQQLSVDLWNGLENGEGPASMADKTAAMTEMFKGSFTEVMGAAGITLTGEALS